MDETVNRYEQKYMLSKKEYKILISLISDKIVKDNYFKETINNVYFDNDIYELINKSIEKPMYKEKIRLRYYNNVSKDSIVYFEIKKKYKKIVNKRRIPIMYSDYLKYIKNHVIPINSKVMLEIDNCVQKHKLEPKICIFYDRLSYLLKENKYIRITFDTNIGYNFFNDNNICFMKDNYIMEIKTNYNMPLWLCNILSELKIYPISYSKIGKIFESKVEKIKKNK